MPYQGLPEDGELPVGLQTPEPLLGFKHSCRGPAQGHPRVLPPLHIPAGLADDAVHRFDDVGTGQRPTEFRGQTQPGQGQDLIQPFQDRAGDIRCPLLETAGAGAQGRLGRIRILHRPGIPEGLAAALVIPGRQAVDDVAGLVDLAALDGDIRPEGAAQDGAEGLGPIDDEEAGARGIKAPLDEGIRPVDNCLAF